MSEMKTLVLQWAELRSATVQVPATYAPVSNLAELTLLVGQLDSEDVTTDKVTSLTWTDVSAKPDAPVLVEIDPEQAVYCAQLIDAANPHAEPIQEWPTPQLASELRAIVREYVGDAGYHTLIDNADARNNNRYPVVSTDGSGHITAYLILTHAPDPLTAEARS